LSPQGDELSPSGSWGICAPALPEVLTGVFNKNCIPGKIDMAESLVTKFDKLDMFDEIYVHVKKDQEKLIASAYPEPRVRVYGVIHSGNLSVDGRSVASLYHYLINSRIAKSMCAPMPSYMYDFMKVIWERTRYLIPSAARDIPPQIIVHNSSTTASLKECPMHLVTVK
jgi:hypothetical protein